MYRAMELRQPLQHGGADSNRDAVSSQTSFSSQPVTVREGQASSQGATTSMETDRADNGRGPDLFQRVLQYLQLVKLQAL